MSSACSPLSFDSGLSFSLWGERLSAGTAIEALMDDLGRALAEPREELFMLGGGNPALIPEICAVWRERLRAMLDSGDAVDRMLGVYDPPQGNARFVKAIAAVLERHIGRKVPLDQLAVTPGGQPAFFALFNLLAGPGAHGRTRHILLPIAPEYIGYRDQGFSDGIFRSVRPRIIETADHEFRYTIDWDRLQINDDTAAICVSRPTNPSGNLLPDEDLERLGRLAADRGIPLIIDNAYGLPFPQILFQPGRMLDGPNIVHVFSLSKVGLPGVRNAVVLAPDAIARRVTSVVAVTGLANPTMGQAVVTPMLERGELEQLSRECIAPFYRRKMDLARSAFAEAMEGVDCALHAPGGAMFLWAWFKGLRIPTRQLYERLKVRGVIVVPGEPFFFGLSPDDEAWPHRHQCVRISFAMPEAVVRRGIEIIAEEVRRGS
jgi:valine--pyruvate aminotransferase